MALRTILMVYMKVWHFSVCLECEFILITDIDLCVVLMNFMCIFFLISSVESILKLMIRFENLAQEYKM